MRVEIDTDKCVGGGQCVLAAAEVFDQRDEDGIVILLVKEPPRELHEKVRRAASLCPAAAIHIVEQVGRHETDRPAGNRASYPAARMGLDRLTA